MTLFIMSTSHIDSIIAGTQGHLNILIITHSREHLTIIKSYQRESLNLIHNRFVCGIVAHHEMEHKDL